MRLQNNIAVRFDGVYGIKFVMTSGTAKLQQQIDNEDYEDIDNSSKSATSLFNIDVTNSNVRAVLAGDAKAYARHIRE